MLSAFPASSRPSRVRRGFTLLEIMVVIALIGFLAAVLAVGASTMLRERKVLPEDVAWEAIRKAREFALLHETEVWLSWDNEERVFRASTAAGSETFPVPEEMDFDLEFLGTSKGGRTIMIGGRLLEAGPIDGVRFFGDGTCTPFRVQLVERGVDPTILEVDPWTCAPVLRNKEDGF
ncbi:type II secretion system protein [Actomonas aquatica]|uniref:Type II secretion system protein n=1 Tax=Actomonas aquatica TaxID=2866162 RepID=A0ABZ1C5I2_9BACT|nr:type II secretion system protein [Opitutus sp. WL0086]WRQ86997.1 type II secretion system protein [Opitutus sp. WL0086]